MKSAVGEQVTVVIDALKHGAESTAAQRKRRDLGDLAGKWKADKDVESALAAQDEPDEELWRTTRLRRFLLTIHHCARA